MPESTTQQVRGWLEGQSGPPLYCPDEPVYFAISRHVECLIEIVWELVNDLRNHPDQNLDYIDNLLNLLRLRKYTSCTGPLVDLAYKLTGMSEVKFKVLCTLTALGHPMPEDYWRKLYAEHGDEVAPLVYSGLLLIKPEMALAFLPEIKNLPQPVADAISLMLQRRSEKQQSEKVDLISITRDIYPGCCETLKLSLREWFEEANLGAIDGS